MIPPIAYVAVACSILPVVAGVRTERRNLIWWGLLAGAVANVLHLGLARTGTSNLFMSYLFPPLETGLFAAALLRWPTFDGWRRVLVGLAALIIMASVYAVIRDFPLARMSTIVPATAAWGLCAVLVVAWWSKDQRPIVAALLLYLVPVAILRPFFYTPIGELLYYGVQGMQSLAYLVFTVAFLVPRREPERLRVA